MSPLAKGILLAGLQIAIVCSLGAKFVHDRATRPRVWAKTQNYDPDLPLRGRYVSLRLQARPVGFPAISSFIKEDYRFNYGYSDVALRVENNELVAEKTDRDTGVQVTYIPGSRPKVGPPEAAPRPTFINEAVAYFIPEHAPNPSIRAADEELWVEVTIPKKGPPRPIRLGVKKNGVITPLSLD